jgi:hypothetical protein
MRRLIALRMEGKFPPVSVSGGAWRIRRYGLLPGEESITVHHLEKLVVQVEAGGGPEWITSQVWPVFQTTRIAAKVLARKGPEREYAESRRTKAC